MPRPFVVHETIPEPFVYASIAPGHDFVPDNPDYYVVTFVRGSSRTNRSDPRRYTFRGIATIELARAKEAELNSLYGEFGRRAIVHAVKGFRSYQV